MTAPPDYAALVKRLRDTDIDSNVPSQDQFLHEAADALEACAMDAARYRWLRDHKTVLRPHNRDGPQYMELIFTWSAWPEPASPLSAAIDRARGKP